MDAGKGSGREGGSGRGKKPAGLGSARTEKSASACGSASSSDAASGQQAASLVVDRARAWELCLRGWSKAAIARELGQDRSAVAGWIAADYAEMERERTIQRERELLAAVARMRAIQQQAWVDHDADDAREVDLLRRAVPGPRYQSPRGQYLRVVLEAEREIARLCGLYESGGSFDGAVVFRIERVGSAESARVGADAVLYDADEGS